MKTGFGWVYIMRNPAMLGLVKIGFTMDDPWERANQLSSTTGVPQPFEVICAKKTGWPAEVEAWLHIEMRFQRVAPNREFFKLPEDYTLERLRLAFRNRVREAVAWHRCQKARQRYEQCRRISNRTEFNLSWDESGLTPYMDQAQEIARLFGPSIDQGYSNGVIFHSCHYIKALGNDEVLRIAKSSIENASNVKASVESFHELCTRLMEATLET